MSLSTLRQRADTMLAFAVQRAEQMEGFHAANYRLALAQFCDFFDQDDVVSLLEEALRRRQVINPKAWYEQSVRESTPMALPEVAAQAMAARYALMKQVRMDKVDLRFVITNVFPGSHLNETLMHWKRLVVHPFVADLRTVSEDVRARLGTDDWVDLLAILDGYLDGDFGARAFGPRAWTDEDDERAEAAADSGSGDSETESEEEAETRAFRAVPVPGDPGVARAVEAERPAPKTSLRAEWEALEQAAAALDDADLELDLLALRLELSRAPRATQRIQRRLDRLGQREALRDACAALRPLV